jgi:hypothetical protein
MHVEKISFKPTLNLEMGFERSAIWGGEGHVPITIHSFLKSFFSFQNVSAAEKFSRNDPGARFGTFDFSYRLPFVRKWLTLYSDSFAHDDVSPPSAPRRAAIRPGIYLSHFPGLAPLDFRVEAVSTDPPTSRSNGGQFIYTEEVQKEGYTNKGYLLGDPVGRESKAVKLGSPIISLSQRRRAVFLSQRESSERLYPRRHNTEQFPVFCCRAHPRRLRTSWSSSILDSPSVQTGIAKQYRCRFPSYVVRTQIRQAIALADNAFYLAFVD